MSVTICGAPRSHGACGGAMDLDETSGILSCEACGAERMSPRELSPGEMASLEKIGQLRAELGLLRTQLRERVERLPRYIDTHDGMEQSSRGIWLDRDDVLALIAEKP